MFRWSRVCRCRSGGMPRLEALRESLATGDLEKGVGGSSLVRDELTATRFSIETRGCQMNSSDSEIVRSLLLSSGGFVETGLEEAEVVLVNTCAIRDKAEAKVWSRLGELKKMKKRVGVLGCMAERVKDELLGKAEVVVGPDAYRDLPRLLLVGEGGVNTQLSLTETYSDVAPSAPPGASMRHKALVSIQRGCDNMCTYCVVPYTRGRERSRPAASVIEECRRLHDERGAREITLLGQNVNSYADYTTPMEDSRKYSSGFEPLIASHKRDGAEATRFASLLRDVARAAPLARIRFISPHPKDFPDQLLQVIASEPNVAKHLHLPAQSGSDSVLEAMRRGYTSDTYRRLVDRARDTVPHVTFSSDFIAGFCGETEEDHRQSLDLLAAVGYEQAFLYAYSNRPKTRADRRLSDDVEPSDKKRRLNELMLQYDADRTRLARDRVGETCVVLVDGVPKRKPSHSSSSDQTPDDFLLGTTDTFRKVIFEKPASYSIQPGDFCVVKIDSTDGHSLFATSLYKSRVDGSRCS